FSFGSSVENLEVEAREKFLVRGKHTVPGRIPQYCEKTSFLPHVPIGVEHFWERQVVTQRVWEWLAFGKSEGLAVIADRQHVQALANHHAQGLWQGRHVDGRTIRDHVYEFGVGGFVAFAGSEHDAAGPGGGE